MSAFRTTRWSLILQTRFGGPEARDALESLCRIYRPAVVAYVRRHGYAPADAEDLAQSFYADILGRDFHARADPARGRFRAYLLTALRHFVASSRAHDDALKRGGQASHLSLGLDDADGHIDVTDDGESPDEVFDRVWAVTVLDQAIDRLERETQRAGKVGLFRELKVFLVEDPQGDDYAHLAERLGMRPNTIAVAVHRLRRRLRAQVGMVLNETVDDPACADAEMAHLKAALGAPAHASIGV
ncbi:sigma-70 family RNA polymerase sigma factor [Dyella halodurans]|uniref:RNA polymerase sigma factor n=1 Tax=Dyella halodurans TaxID=1920171 RepID=A0ABV9C553_9GAMM|nr:sigma-70 family RNA polymerase sigma factor [Dyella halodurans]